MLSLFCCQCFQPKYTLSCAIDKRLKSLGLIIDTNQETWIRTPRINL
ncbi:hypothetical protein EJK48_1974 [Moraxella catarrhalis]|nr:hypothetical protein EJK48_1974 [Moraxella catarrhalis]RUO13980.1 hypothetical protein EJK49_1098 [Moraxella catarrhalis]